jgi:hypothetical protein
VLSVSVNKIGAASKYRTASGHSQRVARCQLPQRRGYNDITVHPGPTGATYADDVYQNCPPLMKGLKPRCLQHRDDPLQNLMHFVARPVDPGLPLHQCAFVP